MLNTICKWYIASRNCAEIVGIYIQCLSEESILPKQNICQTLKVIRWGGGENMPTELLNAYSNGAESWIHPKPGYTNFHHQRTLVGPFSAMAPQKVPLFIT